MSEKPFFSIVTAIRNGLEFFKQTAPSVLSQSFTDWEWIIIDDGSTENIENYLSALNDNRIRYLRNEVPLGQTRSLNRGVRESRADWIVRIDGDDLIAPDRLSQTHQTIQKQNRLRPLVFSDYDVITETGEFIAEIRHTSPIHQNFYSYLKERNNFICHPGVTFFKYSPRKEIYFYDETLKNAQDYALWKQILNDYEEPLCHIPAPLIQYRLVKTSLSGARANEQRQELLSIRKNEVRARSLDLKPELSSRKQAGMYASRILYYRFISSEKGGQGFIRNWVQDLPLALETIQFPQVFAKSMFYFALRPFKDKIKNVLFKNIYK